MGAVLKQKLTVSEYLAAERQSERRNEFFNGEVFAMAGGSREHNRIKENLVGELYGQLKGSACQTYSSDQRVLIEASGLYTYPDVVILCGPGAYDPADRDTLTNPVALIEVLSSTTERYDRGDKFRGYQQIPSMLEYVLVAQDEAVCERYVRQSDGSWALVSFVGSNAVLAFTSIPARIPLADIYAGVVLTDIDWR
jgi:Uma2 family endonuclease